MDSEPRDLQQLREFQAALVPPGRRDSAFTRLATAFEPAEGPVGGDFHDHLELPGGEQAVIIGDVTGHGLPAALVMAVAFGAMREAFRSTQLPCAVLNGLHRLLAELGARSGGPRLFSATIFIGVLDADGSLRHASAGHPPPVLLRASGAVETLAASLPPIGMVDPVACQSLRHALEPGDRLVLYSDGVLAPEAPASEVVERIRVAAASGSSGILASLLAGPAVDDRTAMVLTHLGRAVGSPEPRSGAVPNEPTGSR